MRDLDKPACVAATITLELGIDIGKLDQVLQLNPTSSVSSFVQRLGRTGRRGGPARMFFYAREDEHKPNASVGRQMPWGLLQIIAIIQLYLEEKWIEPPLIPSLPLSLLYHQTMSAIVTHTELTPPELAEQVLSLSPFRNVTFDQYRALLRHLLEIEHLERIDGGGLIIGSSGEKLVNNYHFYATFETEKTYVVRENSRDIGTIQILPDVGDRIRLAGRAWKVVMIDEDSSVVHVERVIGKAEGYWSGSGADIHSRIIQRIRQVLAENVEYEYLQPRAVERLFSARREAEVSDMTREPIIPEGGNRYMLLPWVGTRETETISLLLEYAGMDVVRGGQPFYIEVKAESEQHIKRRIDRVLAHPPQPEMLIESTPRYRLQHRKYDRYLPEALLCLANCVDQLTMQDALAGLQQLSR
jgi:ATP-dependent helicase Lhr and Lhr-like helicase